MGVLIDFFFVIAFFAFGILLDVNKRKKQKRTWAALNQSHEDFKPEVAEAPVHDTNSRTHRIWEVEQRVQENSEAKDFVRLADRKKTEKREPMKKPGAAQSNKHYDQPVHLVKKTVFRNKEEVQKAMIFGEILGTPVSRKRHHKSM